MESFVPSNRMIHSLIYCSQQTFAPESVLEEEVRQIISVSVKNNRDADITGLLLVHAGWFVQALEGRTDRVMATYQRIRSDPRHGGAYVISAGPARARSFGGWNMCARHLNKGNDAILDALSQRKVFQPRTLNSVSALRLLTSISDVKSRFAIPI